MPLIDRIQQDNERVFMNTGQHATTHVWDGKPIVCVVDNETALKRKNNNVVDISWDNDSVDIHLFFSAIPHEGHEPPTKPPLPQQQVEFDRMLYTINQVSADEGMYQITLTKKGGRRL